MIPRSPSAGLWSGQADEAEMGLTYAELDEYLRDGKAEKSTKDKIDLMIEKSIHKRNLPLIPQFDMWR